MDKGQRKVDKGKRNEQVLDILKNFRDYEFAARNCGRDYNEVFPTMMNKRLHERKLSDGVRYNRIVNMVRDAVEYCLDDDQRLIINLKYLERNKITLKKIALKLNVDSSTVSRWHTEAINHLATALEPLTAEEMEITPFDHMFDSEGRFLNISA